MDHPGTGQKVITEIVPVPVDMIPRFWKDVTRVLKWKGGSGIDPGRLHQRLLTGRDRLWLGLNLRSPFQSKYCCVIVTSLSERPPYKSQRQENNRCLFVHLTTGRSITSWIDQAVIDISNYAISENCGQIYVLARSGWRQYALRFYKYFDHVYLGRDRMYNGNPRRVGKFRKAGICPPHRRNSANGWKLYRPNGGRVYVLPGMYADWVDKDQPDAGHLPAPPLVDRLTG